MADKPIIISYRKLFDYVGKEYKIEWSDCHRIFLSKRLLTYNGLSDTFWIDDLEMDFRDNEWYQSEYGRGLRMIYNFLLKKVHTDGVKFRHY